MLRLLTEDVKITKVKDYSSADTADVTSDSVDMAGYGAVMFITSYGTAAANNLIHAEQSADDSSFDDIAGSEPNSAGASSEDQFVDIVQPAAAAARYIRCIAVRGTSSTLESIWAIQYNPRSGAIDNKTAGTIEGEQLIAPVAGTK